MKKLLGAVIVFGFVIMIGAAGSADVSQISFLEVLLLELLGMAIILFGTSALLHYKRYLRRVAKLHKRNRMKTAVHQKRIDAVRICEKKFC